MQSLDDDLALLTRTMLLAGAVVLVLTPVVGFWLSGRSTHLLGRIIQTADRLQPDNLSDRLPLRHTGDELDQMAQTINGLLDRIAAYIDHQRNFIAYAAHDLRSPLTAIRSSVDVALQSVRTPKEYGELLAEISEVCDSLTVLVNQLLVLTESEGYQVQRDRAGIVELDHIVERSAAMFQGLAESRDITLTVAPLTPTPVRGQAVHLRQLVNNLIDNAIKFTTPGGKVNVELKSTASGQIMLQVDDTGIGIAPEDLPSVFERFYRADRSRQRQPGLTGNGLGLSICKAIVTAHKGSIHAESTLGQGSRFLINLPRADG